MFNVWSVMLWTCQDITVLTAPSQTITSLTATQLGRIQGVKEICRLRGYSAVVCYWLTCPSWDTDTGWQRWFCCRHQCNIAVQGGSFALAPFLWWSFGSSDSNATGYSVSKVALIVLGVKPTSGLCCGGLTQQRDTLVQSHCRQQSYE